VPAFSVVSYDEKVSRVVLKAKEDRNKAARNLVAQTITKSLLALERCIDVKKYLLVPIPSSKEAIKRRGESFLHPIMNQVVNLHRSSRDGKALYVDWVEILTYRKKVRDQAGLSSAERSANLNSAFRVAHYLDSPVILVDDVVTTGATLNNAINALRERKMTVLGAITACASAHQLLIRWPSH
jgi:predicted amidophosphoribosyltransferase